MSRPKLAPGGSLKPRASRRAIIVGLVTFALLLAWGILSWDRSTGPTTRASQPTSSGPAEQEAEGEARAGGSEVQQELSEQTAERLEALEEANARGIPWRVASVTSRPAPGWVGEQVADPNGDDWEPAIAADPNAPYVYLLTTHFGDKPCPGNCPVPHISLHVSADAGSSWAPQKPLCACKGSWQYDPQIEVVPDTGAVYASYLDGFKRGLPQVHRPRRDMVGPDPHVGQRLVERQAGARDERRRPGRLHLVERPDGRRPVDRSVP
jgi:hypothetical protein